MGVPTADRRLSKHDAMVMLSVNICQEDGLMSFTPGVFPERPIDLPVDDELVYNAITAARGPHPSRDDEELVRRYSGFRSMLMAAEGYSKEKLKFVAECWEDLAAEAEDAQLMAYATQIAEHIKRYWPNVNLLAIPPKPKVADRDIWFTRATRRDDLAASWLLYGMKPPRYTPRQFEHRGADTGSTNTNTNTTPHWSET